MMGCCGPPGNNYTSLARLILGISTTSFHTKQPLMIFSFVGFRRQTRLAVTCQKLKFPQLNDFYETCGGLIEDKQHFWDP